MQIESLNITQFKSYEKQQFTFHPKMNCIYGENGTGKTNLLDALYYLAMGKSYFNSIKENVFFHESNFFRLVGKVSVADEPVEVIVKCGIDRSKTIEWDGKALTQLGSYIGKVPIVFIVPDDTKIITGHSDERRRFLNNILIQADSKYYESFRKYHKLLKQRNALLKNYLRSRRVDRELLLSLSALMDQPAKNIYKARKKLIHFFEDRHDRLYANISGRVEFTEMSYESGLENEDFYEASKMNLDIDIRSGRTTFGIHKDELRMQLLGESLKRFASQGQIKSYLLALKLSQYEYIRDLRNAEPILLLDDVFDKLDQKRSENLFSLIAKMTAQIFVSDSYAGRTPQLLEQLEINHKAFLIEKIENASIQSGEL